MQDSIKKSVFLFSTVIFLLSNITIAAGSPNSLSFTRIGLEDGLRQVSVYSIHQDHLNRMWFGTRSGLNMWDGERMKVFSDLEGDSTGLPGNDIFKIIQHGNDLWIRAAHNVVCRMNLQTMQTDRYLLPHRDMVVYMDQILVSTSNGLFAFDEVKNKFGKSSLYAESDNISMLYADQDNLWITDLANSEVVQTDKNGNKKLSVELQKNNEITCILADKQELWVGTRTLGIIRYNLAGNKQEFINITSKPLKLADNNVYTIKKDGNNRYWVGTFGGLNLIDVNENITSEYKRVEDDVYSLNQNAINSVYIDNNNFIWVGTYFGGVSYANLSPPVFTKHKIPRWDEGNTFPVVGQMLSDQNDNLWIASEGAGLLYLDRAIMNIRNISKEYKEENLVNLKSIYLKDNKLIIGRRDDGISILDLKKKTGTHQSLRPDEIKRDPIFKIVPFKNDFILATQYGLIKYNPDGSHSFLVEPDDLGLNVRYLHVTTVYVDSEGIIWFGVQGNGLFSYNPENKTIKNYSKKPGFANPLKINEVNCIYEDNFKRLWIGTNGQGLYLLNREEQTFYYYNVKNTYLPSNFIYGIVESRFGMIWISTRNGLCRYDVQNNKFSNYKHKFGFPLDELNPQSIFLDKTGKLFIGGIDGLVSFQEEDIIYTNQKLQVIFSSLSVNNREISANDESKLLTSDISVTKKLVLKPIHTTFRISFSTCNYNRELRNNYQYKLEGFNDDWINSDGESSVTYTNLSPGKYTLLVRGTDMGDSPISETVSLAIIVKPPLSRTWYAYLFYVLVVSGLILLFNRFYIGKIRLAYQLQNERLEKDKLKEINQYKLRFFTNISHEFMTPLTIILNGIEHVILNEKVPGKILPVLKLVYRNSKRLKNLNGELLDFRKIEQGYLKMNVQENDIVSYVQDIFETYKQWADDKAIEYVFKKGIETCFVFYDSVQMDKVFYNLLTNAFNYTSTKNGKVTIELTDNPENVCINVIDNGHGIPAEEIDRIFNRFYQADSGKRRTEYTGSGIGLALSEAIVKAHGGSISCTSQIGEGTTFTVHLKKGKMHFMEDEIAIEKTANQFLMDKDLIPNNDYTQIKGTDDRSEQDEKELMMLIVEDNPDIQYFLRNLFTSNYKIELANNGEDGLKKAIKSQPDIIISDIKMPIISGAEMCEKLKRNITTSHIPIILLTALSSEEDKVAGYKAGADAYITKPFNSQTLVARVENIFSNRKNLQNQFGQDLNTSVKSMAKNNVDEIFMEKAQKICETKISNPEYSVTSFAKDMGMSRTLFFSKIKTITGQTPNDFMQTLRLKKAAKILLNDPTKNVSEIAYEVGFNSPNYFSKSFKNHFGVSPSSYGKIS